MKRELARSKAEDVIFQLRYCPCHLDPSRKAPGFDGTAWEGTPRAGKLLLRGWVGPPPSRGGYPPTIVQSDFGQICSLGGGALARDVPSQANPWNPAVEAKSANNSVRE
jgi:hypothetical protein